MKSVFPFITIICISLSCANQDDNTETNSAIVKPAEQRSYTIDISKPDQNASVVKVSDFCQSVQYIPLETAANCLIKEIRNVELLLPYLVVSTPQDVLMFDINGKFIRRIGKQGNGPGEYNSISDVCLRRSDSTIFISSILNKRILQYTMEGELIATFQSEYEIPADNIAVTGENIFLSFSDYVTGSKRSKAPAMASFDTDMNLQKEFLSTLPVKEKSNIMLMLPNEVLYSKDDIVFIKQVRNDTLYKVINDKMEPYIIFIPGELKMPLEEFTYESFAKKLYGGKYIYFQQVLETEKDIFFSYKYSNKIIKWRYSKSTGVLAKPVTPSGESGFTDDMNLNLTFWPRSLADRKHLAGWLDPSGMAGDELKKIPCSGTFVTENDNPVIQLARLR